MTLKDVLELCSTLERVRVVGAYDEIALEQAGKLRENLHAATLDSEVDFVGTTHELREGVLLIIGIKEEMD